MTNKNTDPSWMEKKVAKEKSDRTESIERKLVVALRKVATLSDKVDALETKLITLGVAYSIIVQKGLVTQDDIDAKFTELGYERVKDPAGEEDSYSNEKVPADAGMEVPHDAGE